jgi:hypothetical protein
MQILKIRAIPPHFITFVMVKYAIISMLSPNKNLDAKNHFFPFRAANIIA